MARTKQDMIDSRKAECSSSPMSSGEGGIKIGNKKPTKSTGGTVLKSMEASSSTGSVGKRTKKKQSSFESEESSSQSESSSSLSVKKGGKNKNPKKGKKKDQKKGKKVPSYRVLLERYERKAEYDKKKAAEYSSL